MGQCLRKFGLQELVAQRDMKREQYEIRLDEADQKRIQVKYDAMVTRSAKIKNLIESKVEVARANVEKANRQLEKERQRLMSGHVDTSASKIQITRLLRDRLLAEKKLELFAGKETKAASFHSQLETAQSLLDISAQEQILVRQGKTAISDQDLDQVDGQLDGHDEFGSKIQELVTSLESHDIQSSISPDEVAKLQEEASNFLKDALKEHLSALPVPATHRVSQPIAIPAPRRQRDVVVMASEYDQCA